MTTHRRSDDKDILDGRFFERRIQAAVLGSARDVTEGDVLRARAAWSSPMVPILLPVRDPERLRLQRSSFGRPSCAGPTKLKWLRPASRAAILVIGAGLVWMSGNRDSESHRAKTTPTSRVTAVARSSLAPTLPSSATAVSSRRTLLSSRKKQPARSTAIDHRDRKIVPGVAQAPQTYGNVSPSSSGSVAPRSTAINELGASLPPGLRAEFFGCVYDARPRRACIRVLARAREIERRRDAALRVEDEANGSSGGTSTAAWSAIEAWRTIADSLTPEQ